MTIEKIEKHLVKVLAEIQKTSGKEDCTIDNTTIPFNNLFGFDSHRVILVIVKLEIELGVSLNRDIQYYFKNDIEYMNP